MADVSDGVALVYACHGSGSVSMCVGWVGEVAETSVGSVDDEFDLATHVSVSVEV